MFDVLFVLVVVKVVGGWGGVLVSLCVFIGVVGLLGGWILLIV